MRFLRPFLLLALAIGFVFANFTNPHLAASPVPQVSAPKASSSGASTQATPSKPVDINAASMGELKSIPGIGDAYASKIIAGRPYKNKAQLKTRNILPSVVYDKTKDYMIAKQK